MLRHNWAQSNTMRTDSTLHGQHAAIGAWNTASTEGTRCCNTSSVTWVKSRISVGPPCIGDPAYRTRIHRCDRVCGRGLLDFGLLVGPVGVAHDAFERFAGGGAWKVRHEHDPTELLEAGFDACVDPGHKFGFGDAAWRM
jgi:hypothetical protein